MSFYSATENMAALLRSARLLKFSPSGLLQITGTKRNGLPLGRLYSGALGSRTTGVYSRQISPASGNAASRLWPYAGGCVRHYAIATDQRDEAGSVLRSMQSNQFDMALTKLDNSVRKTGRITKTLLLRIFHDMCREGYPSSNQALLLLRSCGSLLAEVPHAERTELAHRIWEKLQHLGAQYDVSHYNALLKVYLQNEFKFSPTDFLAKIEEANLQPNRVTYQRLIAAYCQNGDIEGASTILGFMKSKDLPITEAVFNSLVTGHARAGDMESAKNTLSVMKGAGIVPGPDTYLALLYAYAEKGDMDSLKKTMEEAESADCSLMNTDIMQVIFTLAKAGHQQHIPEMIVCLKQDRGYIPNAMNFCLSLITQKHEDTAFLILKTFPALPSESPDNSSASLGNFFLRHCVNMDMPLEKISYFCKELQESNLHTSAFNFTLFCALDAKKTGLSLELMKIMKEQGLPIRPHFFWPLLTQHVKNHNTAGVLGVVKGMQELEVSPCLETVRNYVFPVFPNKDAAREALKGIGVTFKPESLMISEIQAVAERDLAETYNIWSDPSYPLLDFRIYRSSLILGFRKSSDVESMVKITELLFKGERFSQTSNKDPTETASFFLYNVISSMSDAEVQAQEGKLRNYFNQLKAQNISISGNIYRGIRKLLDNYGVPQLIKNVAALTNPSEQVSDSSVYTFPGATAMELEKKLAELKAENQPIKAALRLAIRAFCADMNLQRALELKQQHEEDVTIYSYATLISLCCRQNNAEEALNLKREMSRKDPSVTLDTRKYIELVATLTMNDKMEEAVDMLKEMKEKNLKISDTDSSMLFHCFTNVATKCGASAVQRLQDTIFTLGLAKPTANFCSPLISFCLDSKDLTGAVEAVMECQKRYKQMPRIHSIAVALLKEGDMDLLRKVMDFICEERGEMSMIYELFFAFLQTGRYDEARKLFEAPGLRARPGRLNWYAEKCISSNQTESLEQMVDITAKLFECDRDEMYRFLLRLYHKMNNWQKAEATWTKIQEENIIPREATLRILADILKSNNQEVPFEVPEVWYQQDATTQQVKNETSIHAIKNGSSFEIRLFNLCKRDKAIEAYATLKEANGEGIALSSGCYDHVIRSLLSQSAIEEAMVVKDIAVSHQPSFRLSTSANSLITVTLSKKGQAQDALENLKSMLQANQLPSQLAISRLLQALSSCGNVAGIQEVESLLKDRDVPPSSFMIANNMAFAHIKSGDVDTAVELLEALFTCPDSKQPGISFIFRKVLEENNDKALDKLSAMAERLANHFACIGPSLDLFLQLLDANKVEDAKFMLARCNALAEQKERLLSYMTQKAQRPGQSGKIKTLVSLIPDFAEKELVYQYLMKCYDLDQDLSSAKDLYEQMQKEGIVVNELSLKRLAVLYRKAGETAPFPEPPEDFIFYINKLRGNTANAQTAAKTRR